VVSKNQGDGELVVSDNEVEGGRRRTKGMEKEGGNTLPEIKNHGWRRKRAHQKEIPQHT
jgi:hypothetical protein